MVDDESKGELPGLSTTAMAALLSRMDGIVDPHGSNRAFMEFQFAKKLAEFRKIVGDGGVAQQRAAYVSDHASAFDVCSQARLCHDDVYENNVLVHAGRGELKLSGLLDVENAVAGDPLLDLAKTWMYSIKTDMSKWAALVDGYGPLGDRAAERLNLYRTYHAVELCCWLATTRRTAPAADLVEAVRAFTTGANPLPVR